MKTHTTQNKAFVCAIALLLQCAGLIIAQPDQLPTQKSLPSKRLTACPPVMKLSSFQGDGIEPKPLYTRFVNPAQCYCRVWQYFINHQKRFRGEDGSSEAKNSLVRNKVDVVLSSEKVFTRIFRDGPRRLNDYVFQEPSLITIDIGANIGQNVAFFKQILPKDEHDMYFFEPNPINWERLNETLRELPNSHLIQKAVSEKPGQMFFEPPHKVNQHGNRHAHIVPEGDAPRKNAFKVDVVTLDGYFSSPKLANRPILFLKIDAEGFDVTILRSSKDVLSRTRFLIFECHLMMNARHAKGPGGTHQEAQNILSGLGFDVFKISKDVWIPFSDEFYHPIMDEPKFMGWHNCMAIRRDDPVMDKVYKEHSSIDECKTY